MTASPASSADTRAQSFENLSRYLGARVTMCEDSSIDIVIPGADYSAGSDGRPSNLAITCAVDIATGMASSMASDSPGATLTSDMSVSLLAQPAPGDLHTVGRVIKMGKRVIMNEAVVQDSAGRTVAFATVGCAPVPQLGSDFTPGKFPVGYTLDLASPEHAGKPIDELYDTTPPSDWSQDGPKPVASIELTELTKNPFGILHGAVGAYLLLSGAQRAGLRRVDSITVRYLRPTTHGPADVVVDAAFTREDGSPSGFKLSLRDRATGKIACAAQVTGSPT